MAFGAVDIPRRGVDDFRETLRVREAKLADAKKQRDVIQSDIAKASDAADFGDQRARLELNGLNKSHVSIGRLILSLEAEVDEGRKRLAMAQAQVDAVHAKAAVPIAEGAERLFLVNTPHHLHQVRHKACTIESLRSRLLPGYTIEGEIFGANDAGEGGVVAAIEPTGPTVGIIGEVDSMLSRTRASLAPAQPVLCILDNIDPPRDEWQALISSGSA
jgi:hypothetical protein